jgi:hypothetical protein
MFTIFLRYFEKTAIEILANFDLKENDDLNIHLLLSRLNCFKCRLIDLAFHGDCKRFIASDTVQKVFSLLMTSAIVFSPNRILFFKSFSYFQVYKNINN